MIGMLVAAPIIMWGVPIVLIAFGASPPDVMEAVLPLAIAWMVIGVIGSWRMDCPNCALSVFRRGIFRVPWPASRCSECGTDLTR